MLKLTSAERLILKNQYLIMQMLEEGEDEFGEIITALDRGYDEDFKDLTGHHEEMTSAEDQELVRDVLWIYYLMKIAYNRSSLDANTMPTDVDGRRRFEEVEPKFPGFDGNDSSGRYGYAHYLVKTRKQFQEHNHYLNSHGGQPDYDHMREVWISWGRPSDLSMEQVRTLLGRWFDMLPKPVEAGSTE